MNKRALMLTVAAAALMGTPAYAATVTGCDSTNTTDYTDITTKITVPLCTLYANKGAAGNILIDTDGSLIIPAPASGTTPVPAITVDSSNIVTNKETIEFNGVTSAIGVQLDSDAGNGPISGAFDNQGTLELNGSGTSKIGILITTPTTPAGLTTTFTGVMPLPNAGTAVTNNTAIDLEGGSTVEIQGDSSIGIELASGTNLAGDILIGGSLTVSPTTVGETTGNGGTGVELLGNMTGNFAVQADGLIEGIGPGSQGVVLDGPLNGAFTNYGTVEAVPIATPNTSVTTNPESGSALVIEGNVTGGIYNSGPSVKNVTETSGTIGSSGTQNAPTLFITPFIPATGSPTGVVISPATDPDAVVGDSGYGLLNRGSIVASPSDANTSVTAVRFAGVSPTANVMVDGGILDAGTISASGTTTDVNTTTPIDVNAIIVDNYATVPSIVTSSEEGHGVITAQESGAGEAVVTAIQINATNVSTGYNGSVTTITNAGTISASATTSDDTIAELQAYAIRDFAGTITTINNTGTISATVTSLTDGLQVARAADLSNSESNITFTNNGTVTGDVLFGQGNDTLTVEGLSTSTAASVTGNINFGGSGNLTAGVDTLTIGGDAASDSVIGEVQEQGAGSVDVTINPNAALYLKNNGDLTNQSLITSTNLPVSAMTVYNKATLGLTLAQAFNLNATQPPGSPVALPIVQLQTAAAGNIDIMSGAVMNVSFGTFISATDTTDTSEFVLLDAPAGKLIIGSPNQIATDIAGPAIPFLFTGTVCGYNLPGFTGAAGSATPNCAAETGVTNYEGTDSQLVLSLVPKTPVELGLTGYAAKMFPLANAALASDNALGAAVINGVTSNATAQQVYSSFAPDVTGAVRAEAISLTDQATGPVGARQRALRMYAGQDGDATLWGQEFAQRLQVGNQVAAAGYDDSGFGFVLGMDAGDPADGRYGGAFTFYSGDADEKDPREDKTTSEWYMLTGYTDWRGKGFFFDSQINAGYGSLDGKRDFDFGGVSRVADGKRAAALLSGGATAGVAMTSGGTVLMPQISVDALTMREEGYTETNNGATTSQADDGFDLTVHQEYAQSVRGFAGFDVRQDLNLGDFFLQPEARVGYRYDFVDGAEKLKAEFACSTVTATSTETPCAAAPFSITGPDPARGNLIAGGGVAATTGAWSIGLSFDYLRGVGGVTGKDTISQTGTLTLVGRI